MKTNDDGEAIMPGFWRCKKCGFGLQLSELHLGDGTITAKVDAEGVVCPNDGEEMERTTWRQMNSELYERCLALMEENATLKEAIDRLMKEQTISGSI
jgi:hypothetical protein